MKKLVKIFIRPIYIFTIISLCGCNHVENRVNEINDVKYSVSVRNAQLIINQVELAYNTEYMLNETNVPTLKQISDRFLMSNVTMDSNGNITTSDDNINCKTDIENNFLKVTCRVKDYQISTTNEMLINF